MTAYFCDGMEMGCVANHFSSMSPFNNRYNDHFSKNGIEMGWFSHASEV